MSRPIDLIPSCGLPRVLLMAGLLLICLLCVVVARWLPYFSPTENMSGQRFPHVRAALGTAIWQERERLMRPQFTPQEHFLRKPTQVAIRCALPGADIHYTLDGSTPTSTSPRYTAPLDLAEVDGASCIPLKAVAILDGQAGPVAVHTYFLDALAAQPNEQSLIFSLSTAADNLYGHDKGILVAGKTSAEATKHPRNPNNPDKVYANYRERGRAWERPVDVEIFAPDGTRLLARSAGLRVSGGASRAFAQKSLRLVARKTSDGTGKRFAYPFFPASACSHLLPPVHSFKHLLLSSSGQDLLSAQVRTTLLTRLALRAGYRWASPHRPASVYLNGLFYGFAWLTPRFDASLLGSFFDRPGANFVVLDGDAASLRSSPRYPWLLHWREIDAFNSLLARCAQQPMDDALLEDMRRLLDVREALFYYALEIYVDNRDWPESNVRLWRYAGQDAQGIPELDGRWRYVLFDLDAAAMSPWHGMQPPSHPSLSRVLKASPLLATLLSRKDLAVQFANDMCDLAFAHYSAANVTQCLAELDAESGGEPQRSALRGVYAPPHRRADIVQGRENMLLFFRERPDHALDELRKHLGLTDLYEVRVQGLAMLNTLGPTNPHGRYFVENSVQITPCLPPHQTFLHWEVNGQTRHEERLTVSVKDSVNNVVKVRLIARDEPYPLSIEHAREQAAACTFALRNRSGKAVSLSGLFLSDNPEKPYKFALPARMLQPGEALLFVGRDTRHASALGRIRCNFNPRRGESVLLYGSAWRLLSSAAVE